jgi:hypothetical protein
MLAGIGWPTGSRAASIRAPSPASKLLAKIEASAGGGTLELEELELLDVELELELELELLLEDEPGKPRQASILPTPVLASTCGLTSTTGSTV